MLKKTQPAIGFLRHTRQIEYKGGTMGLDVMGVIAMMIPIAVFAMVVLIVWLGVRQKERESANRHELLRKIAESQEAAAQRVLDMIREQEYEAQIRRREGLKLGGLITSVVGLAFMPMMYMLERSKPTWIVGIIPLLVGIILSVYVFFLAPKLNRGDRKLP
jgi:Na+/H+ antiporter NhaD/arsenite permease-like protein